MEERLNAEEKIFSKSVKRKKMKWIPVVGILLFIIVASIIGGLYFKTGQWPFGMQKFLEKPQIEQMIPLDSFLVNLKDERSTHFLKTSITLSILDDESKAIIDLRMPQIRDVVIQHLRGLSKSEISEAQTLEIIRLDLLDQLNQLFEQDILYNLYFTDFLIQ